MSVTPKQYALDCIQRARNVADAAPTAAVAGDDLLRLALALGVAALDTLIHWVVLRSITKSAETTPKSLARISVDYGDLAHLADRARGSQRSGTRWKPWVVVMNIVQEKLLRKTFQSKEEVATGLAMAGIDGGWKSVCDTLQLPSRDVEDRLSTIVRRRNQIVHEGDYRRMARPRTVETNAIDSATVRADLDWLESFIGAISTVAGY